MYYIREIYSFQLTRHGGYLFSIAYLFCGTNIVASGIFTALSDGKTSALISFLRTFVFIVLSALLLPLVLGTNGGTAGLPGEKMVTETDCNQAGAEAIALRDCRGKKW